METARGDVTAAVHSQCGLCMESFSQGQVFTLIELYVQSGFVAWFRCAFSVVHSSGYFSFSFVFYFIFVAQVLLGWGC